MNLELPRAYILSPYAVIPPVKYGAVIGMRNKKNKTNKIFSKTAEPQRWVINKKLIK